MAKVICTVCHTAGNAGKKTPGSILIELVLWCFFIVPGLIYSLWRMASKKAVCRSCGSEAIVPVGSPAGQRLLSQQKP